ncbi:unnamed protein product, partial [Symbiodinium natans]
MPTSVGATPSCRLRDPPWQRGARCGSRRCSAGSIRSIARTRRRAFPVSSSAAT